MQKKGAVVRGLSISTEVAMIKFLVYWPPLVPGLCLSQGTKKHASQVLRLTKAVEAADNRGISSFLDIIA